ncbi:MAG: TonB-dependent receptor [Dehalococcoidia bacterium]|jgi:iron complex outermembrane receptor protein|nr:TonB-dependent receptor [Candidatus Neomarinimicrobiota bacterium]MDP7675068.1 TonB-dependent receptor [Dehalococcoidia bacterium]|tara:strand:- start:773 stop:2935 length:2163 start_codon:yes stop_codon:yes gene_type:complete
MIRLTCFIILFHTLTVANTGGISGRVVNIESGQPIPNANILLEETLRGTASGENGYFLIPNLPEGQHNVRVSSIGYAPFETSLIVIPQKTIHLECGLIPELIMFRSVDVIGLLPSKYAPESAQLIQRSTLADYDRETVSDMLSALRGVDVQMAHIHSRNVNISIRGSSDYKPGGYNNRVLLLIDGFPAQIPNTGAPDWNAVPIENIERVEVVRGPASSLYGHNSMGGVVNIVTKNPGDTKKIETGASVGSFNAVSAMIKYSTRVKSSGIQSSFGYNSSEGHRFNADHELLKGSIKMSKNLKEGRKLIGSIIASKSVNGHPGFVYPEKPELVSYRRSDRDAVYVQGFYSHLFSHGTTWTTSFALNRFNTLYLDRKDTPEDEREGETRYFDWSLVSRNELQLIKNGAWVVLLGTDLSYDHTKVSVLSPVYGEPEQYTVAGFIQTRRLVKRGWTIGFGSRLDYRMVNPGNGYNTRKFLSLSPKLNMVYTQKGNRVFHISVNKGFRAPSISELYLQYQSDYGLTFQGTPTLNPETLWAAEIGYDNQHLSFVHWTLNLFYNHYRDMIDFVYTLPVRAMNRNNVQGTGAELALKFRICPGLSVNVDYSYLRMIDLDGRDPILYRPKHKLVGTATYQYGRLSIFFTGRYHDSQRYSDFLSDEHDYEDDKIVFPLKSLPAIAIYDINVHYQWGRIKIGFSTRNLMNTKYSLIQDFPMPMKNWKLKFSL